MILRVIALCVAAAMICSALRTQRPEMATAVSLAAGLAALALLYREFAASANGLDALRSLLRADEGATATVLKAAGIAVVSELGAQLCSDAGESALAGRIALAARVAMLGLCAPMLSEIAGMLGGLFA